VVFTDPQIAAIGVSEQALSAAGLPFIKASYPFNDHGKSIVMDEMLGHVTVLADPKEGRILGAEIAGPDASELIHCFSIAMAMKARASDMLLAPWYHPTLAEIITYPLEEIVEACKGPHRG
jgi:pyruvate/2-oxoglutarate dehydrogenase complex dihydrolipoamide dehydrogenase (E3) component